MIMTVCSHSKHLECPPPRAIALLQGNSKLIHINELPTWHLVDTKRKRVVEEGVDSELCVITLSLIAFR
jgi:hypothetical protein